MTTRNTLAALVAASLAFAGCGTAKLADAIANGTDLGAADTTASFDGTGSDGAAGTDDGAGLNDSTGGGDGTVGGDDTGKDGGKSDAKDAGKDGAKAEVTAPAATWGECAISDTTCMSGCVQSNCIDQYSACQKDPKCKKFETCAQNCGKTPAVLPPQDTTPVTQLPGESTQTYCLRVCEIQAGPATLALDEGYYDCLIGHCVDCANSAPQIPADLCKATCGLVNFCTTEYDACLSDKDCTELYGCLLICGTDKPCQMTCQDNTTQAAIKLLNGFNTCENNHANDCTAP